MLVDFFIISYWFRFLFKERNRPYAELLIVMARTIYLEYSSDERVLHGLDNLRQYLSRQLPSES